MRETSQSLRPYPQSVMFGLSKSEVESCQSLTTVMNINVNPVLSRPSVVKTFWYDDDEHDHLLWSRDTISGVLDTLRASSSHRQSTCTRDCPGAQSLRKTRYPIRDMPSRLKCAPMRSQLDSLGGSYSKVDVAQNASLLAVYAVPSANNCWSPERPPFLCRTSQ